MVYFAIKCVKTGVVINDQQNIGTRRDTLIDGATSSSRLRSMFTKVNVFLEDGIGPVDAERY